MKYKLLLIILLIAIFSSLTSGFLISDQGTNVREVSTGNLTVAANLSITIYDSLVGGNLIFEQNFTNAIINGSWNLMINPNLSYGKTYWKDYSINGEDLDFDGTERIELQSSVGKINNVSFINFSLIDSCPDGSSIRYIYENGSVLCVLVNTSFNQTFTDSIYAGIQWAYNMTTPFTNWLATFDYDYNQTTPAIAYTDAALVANNDSFRSTYNFTYNASIIWAYNQSTYAVDYANSTFLRKDGGNGTGTYNFNNGWQDGGLSIIGGSIYAQTMYIYNVSSLGVSNLNVNGSLIPMDFNNTFDVGNTTMQWRYGYFGTDIYLNGGSVNKWLYNQTTPATAYADASLVANNDSFRATYNESYNKWAYNQSIMVLNQLDNGTFIPYTGSNKSVSFGGYNFSVGNSLMMDMRIGNQRLGIGTDNPLTRLHVYVDDGQGIPTLLDNTDILLSDTSTTSDSAVLSLVGGSEGSSTIKFGDSNDVDAGEILYGHKTGAFNFSVNGSDDQMMLNITGLYLGTSLVNIWLYNQSSAANDTVYNTYGKWFYNETTAANDTMYGAYGGMWYNQTTPAIVYTDAALVANNDSWSSTYNETYAGLIDNVSYLSTYNETYDKWAYNQTTPNATNGTGTAGYIPQWQSANTLNNSIIYQTNTKIGIGTTIPTQTLDVNGTINVTNDVIINNTLYADKIVGKTNKGIGYGSGPTNGYRHYFYGSANNITARYDATTTWAAYYTASSGGCAYYQTATGRPIQTYSTGGTAGGFGTTPQTNNTATSIEDFYAYKKAGANITVGWGLARAVNMQNNENVFIQAFYQTITWLNSSTGKETSKINFQTISNGTQKIQMSIFSDGVTIGTQTQQPGYNVTITGALYVEGNVTASGLYTHSYAFTGNAIDRIKLMKADMSKVSSNGWASVDHASLGDIAVNIPYNSPIIKITPKTECHNRTDVDCNDIIVGYYENGEPITERRCEEKQYCTTVNEEEIIGYEQKTIWLTDQEKLTDVGIKAIQELITKNEELEARIAAIEAKIK